MSDDQYSPRDDHSYSGEAPTLSGYLEHADIMDGDDHAAKRALEEEQHEQFREHVFKPKPAVVRYHELYNYERRLVGVSKESSHSNWAMGTIRDARENQLPRLNKPAEREATAKFISSRYEQWERDYRTLDDRQRASYEGDFSEAVERRQNHPENTQSRDTSEFFARWEVVGQYNIQKDDLRQALEKDIHDYVDQGVERQVETNRRQIGYDGAPLDEIIYQRRPKERDHGHER
jgi:hypothetical protein